MRYVLRHDALCHVGAVVHREANDIADLVAAAELVGAVALDDAAILAFYIGKRRRGGGGEQCKTEQQSQHA